LRTKLLAEALLCADVIRKRLTTLFALGRTGMLTDKQIHDLLVAYVQRSLDRDEQKRAAGEELRGSVPDVGEIVNDYNGEFETLCDAMIHGDQQRATGGAHADRVLRSSGLTEPKDSPGYAKLCREVLKAQLEIVETQLARFQGDYDNPYDARFSFLADATLGGKDQAPVNTPAQKEPSGPLLSEVIDRYVKECGVKDSWTEKTAFENKAIYRVLVGLLGDQPITDLTRDDIVGVLEQIKRLPSNYSKKYPGKTIPEILSSSDIEKHEPLGTNSVQKYMRRISSVFRHVYRAGILPTNIAEGVTLHSDVPEQDERSVFAPEDIQKIVEKLPTWAATVVAKNERFWIPLIGLHSGMRLNEICQLHIEDIREIDGVWCFDVNENEEKIVKTNAGKRCVPLHPLLVEVGLLAYWKRMKDEKQERLWPELKISRDGYGQSFSKSFGKFNRKYVTDDPKKVFHSFRHTLADQLKQKGQQEVLICQIIGHKYEGSESMTRYAKPYPPKVLHKALTEVEFGLDVAELKRFADSLLT
jgi:integrase